MYRIIVLFLVCSFSNAIAFVIWPNASAPCDSTLQACIDGSPEGEYIEIRTNSINENISTITPISLVAGSGYHPVFSSGNNIEIHTQSNNNHILNIRGLTLTGGRFSYIHRGLGNVTLNISHNIIQNGGSPNALRLQLYSPAIMSVNLEYNQVWRSNTITSGGKTGSIFLNKAVNSNGGEITGRIYNNSITAYGDDSVGLGIFDSTQGNIKLAINANVFYGGGWGAITARKEADSGLMEIDAISNAFYSAREDLPFFRGIRINAQSGIVKLSGISNTMLGADSAFLLVDSSSSTLTNNIFNNIMAFGNFSVNSNTNVINNDYNLTYQNQFTDLDFVPGVNHISSNPQVKSMRNGRLRNNSPAIDTGSVIAYTGFFDGNKIDADGLLRIKNGSGVAGNDKIDMGAYEYGDLSFVHKHSGGNSHISLIDHPKLNNMPDLDDLHVNSNWNPRNSSGIYNPDNEALYYALGAWRVFNENNTQIEFNSAFNITKFASSENTFEHLASPSNNNSTTIDSAGLNGNIGKILHISQHWKSIYNRHPIGILYSTGNWKIVNFDLQNIPDGSNFNVYVQDPSKSAWIHRATDANIFNHYTLISHPLLNGVDCANVQVTQSARYGVFNGNTVGVWYNGSNWSIFNQDASDMPIDAAFHVLINPEQISECTDLIFKNSFE